MPQALTCASWNVNSIRARLEHLRQWSSTAEVDVLMLQETKVEDSLFPHEQLKDLWPFCYYSGQKAYNGVALLSRYPLTDISTDFADPLGHKRYIAACCGNKRLICVYVPNGSSRGSEKFVYKLQWLAAFNQHLEAELKLYPDLLLMGDFNIAPQAQDLWDEKAWKFEILITPEERSAFFDLCQRHHLTDVDAALHPESRSFTWWDYRIKAFSRNLGLRIDLALASTSAFANITDIKVDTVPRQWPSASDHAPVIVRWN